MWGLKEKGRQCSDKPTLWHAMRLNEEKNGWRMRVLMNSSLIISCTIKHQSNTVPSALTIADEHSSLMVPSLKQFFLQHHPWDWIPRRFMDQIAHSPSNRNLIVLNLPTQCLRWLWSPVWTPRGVVFSLKFFRQYLCPEAPTNPVVR